MQIVCSQLSMLLLAGLTLAIAAEFGLKAYALSHHEGRGLSIGALWRYGAAAVGAGVGVAALLTQV